MKLKHFILLFWFIGTSGSCISQNVVLVVIDGARYTETFGDSNFTYVPKMKQLSTEGTYINTFYNDGDTYTSHAVPALWCGTWAGVHDTTYNGSPTQYTIMPTIFEYYRKQKSVPETDAIYELLDVSSLWLQSFHSDYGQNYWPLTISQGNNDNDVLDNAISDMQTYHPKLSWVYFADVDHAGHSGNWDYYVNTIANADSLVFELWNFIQSDSYYKNNTIMLVTNDHGRHTTDFSGHGDDCDGCRHIMFLAMGTNIKKNYVSNVYRATPDFATTAAYILGVNPEYSTGNIISEIFQTEDIARASSKNDFWVSNENVKIIVDKETTANISIFNVEGKLISKISNRKLNAGENNIFLNNNLRGIYIVTIQTNEFTLSKKVVF